LPACHPPDVYHDFFCRFLHRPGFLSQLRPLKASAEPEILPSSFFNPPNLCHGY
jgi:hypothetical protein